jgi:head-tail adaptor
VFLLVLAVIAAVGAAVAAPLVRPRRERSPDRSSEERAVLEARKEVKYREIRDAEADFRTGKLSEADYRALDRVLRREAIEILREIDELGDRPA